MNRNRYAVQAIFALCIMYCIVLTACPKDTAVHKAARASYELAGITRDVIAGVDKAYTDHVISVEQKNVLADKLTQIAKGGQAFNAIATQVSNSNTVPQDKWILLQSILNDQIVSPFLGLLETLKAISPATATALFTATAALRTAILVISQVISSDTYGRVSRSSLTNG